MQFLGLPKMLRGWTFNWRRVCQWRWVFLVCCRYSGLQLHLYVVGRGKCWILIITSRTIFLITPASNSVSKFTSAMVEKLFWRAPASELELGSFPVISGYIFTSLPLWNYHNSCDRENKFQMWSCEQIVISKECTEFRAEALGVLRLYAP